jgi:hypothetical protein
MADVASAAGGSGGRRDGDDEPPRGPPPPVDVPEDQEEVEDEEAGSEEDEPQIGRRVQCQTCMRWVLRSVGLERHAPKCVGYPPIQRRLRLYVPRVSLSEIVLP